MASLNIRKLDDHIYDQLCCRAEQHGISVEEEVRQIIYRAIAAPHQLTKVFANYFGKNNGIDLNNLHQHHFHEPIELKPQ